MLHCKFIQEASIQVRHILPLKEIHLPEQKKLDQESLVFKKKKKQEEEEYSANELDDSEVGSEDEFDDNDNDDDPSVFFENNSSLSKLGRTENGNSLLDSQQEYILSLEDDTQRIARDTRKYFLI
jgi:hypothetical protein